MRDARAHDPALYLHSVFVGELTASFASYLGVDAVEQRRLVKAALLHDIGKLQIPAPILQVPRKLTPEENLLIRTHPSLGFQLLKEAGEADELLLAAVRDHDERLDGTGYPRGIRAEEIPFGVRVVALCDVFAAMTEDRPYTEQLDWAAALNLMSLKKMRLDMALLKKFAIMVTVMRTPKRRWRIFRNWKQRRPHDCSFEISNRWL